MGWPTLSLKNGNFIPMLGFGTRTAWYKDDPNAPINPELIEVLKTTVLKGFIHIDAADSYGTEREVEITIKESGIPRDKLFITTKVLKGWKDVRVALNDSLQQLQVDYVEMYLLHNPYVIPTTAEIQTAWKGLETLHAEGKARNIGVSNFQRNHLEALLEDCSVVPAINQLEYHPYLQRADDYVPWMREHGIEISSFKTLAPITVGKGGPLDLPLSTIAAKHNTSTSTVVPRWVIDQNVVGGTHPGDPYILSDMYNGSQSTPHPSDPSASQVFLPRHQTVRKLANRIHEQRVVLARGTPSSGKTFLARSLHTYLRGQGVKSIYIRNFPLSLEGGPSALHYLLEACHIQGFAALGHSFLRDNFVFLIDDAHTTYNNSELWLILNAMNQDHLVNVPGASFCMFSAFGTPDRGVMPHNMGSDLLVFNEHQRVFMVERFADDISLFYTTEEVDLYMEMHFQARGSDYEICDILKDTIHGLTGGQPELMDAFMHLCDMLYEAFYKDDELDIISEDDSEITQLFEVRGILEVTIAAIVNFAGLPLSPETFFPPEQEFEVLRQAQHARGQGLLFDPQSEAMLSCLTKGWLHMEENREGEFRCCFPTMFHNRLVEYLMGVQDLRYPTPPTLNRGELELMFRMRNMTIS
ncbi:Aldo/keto reductase [Penicillium expansum]|nr:Aldo/keto reductase [Penicillium expansum]